MDQSVPRKRKMRGQGASRRGEILAAAKRLFVEDGFQNVTMRGIAAAVGVSATALYVYFSDKDAILDAIAAEHFAALAMTLEQSIRPDRPAPENLRAGLRAYIAFALARPDVYRLTFLRTYRTVPEAECRIVPEAETSFGILLRSVQDMIDAGYFPAKPAHLMAEALWACAHGIASLLLTLPEKFASDPEILIEQVVDMSVNGLRILPLLT